MNRPLRIIAQPAFTRRELNPYNALLYTSIADAGAEVTEFTARDLLRRRHDIWHIHWPDSEAWLYLPRLRHAVQGTLRLLALLRIARARGTRIVWTVHDLHSHDMRHPRLEKWFWRTFLRQVDGAFNLSASGEQAALAAFPPLRAVPHFVVAHGHYRGSYRNDMTRADARTSLGIAPDARVLSFVGQIRQYKNVPELITATRRLAAPDTVLLIGGRPDSRELEERVRAAAADDARVQLHLRLIAADEMQLYLNAADLVVLPYRDILNSGAALLALSFDRPILVPGAGALPELQAQVGADWVRTFTGTLTPDVLRDALDWSQRPRPAQAPLHAHDWNTVARATLAAYSDLLLK